MAEEFQESDVVFSDYDRDYDEEDSNGYFTYQELVMSTQQECNSGKYCKKNKKNKKMKMKNSSSNSVPVDINIPNNLFQFVDRYELEEGYQDGEIIPPHVIVGRRLFAEKMAFSVCSGNGRTLKGRDLSHVRNSILRMTGFLET
ncbi:hypothetical protein ACOSP7_011691 [Xanthoceras sorbifolium]|uniref:Senescence regulator n=1 Tax=Xanthoceras sorbifolium TaxID=99658 RepID=A0ABQ8HWN0_9ROSI|nr:hypothetical protein JRO89_XS06G0029700 [Xanthoceras sorbifolium]